MQMDICICTKVNNNERINEFRAVLFTIIFFWNWYDHDVWLLNKNLFYIALHWASRWLIRVCREPTTGKSYTEQQAII